MLDLTTLRARSLYARAGRPLRQPHPHGLVARIARPRATRTARARAASSSAREVVAKFVE